MHMESKSTHFAGSPLNRLSWLRPSHIFLNGVVEGPTTRWLIFNAGQPLISNVDSKKQLAQLPTSAVLSLLGPRPLFGQLESPSDDNTLRVAPTTEPSLEAARHLPGADKAPTVFLGILEDMEGIDPNASDEGASALPSSSFSGANPEEAIGNIHGTPFFALEVAKLDKDLVQTVVSSTEFGTLEFMDARAAMTSAVLDSTMAAVFAEARSLLDWNARNMFCPACGTATYELWGGWKKACRTLLPWIGVDAQGKACVTVKGLHNFTHPRTDPVVIMVVIDESGDRILLGKAKKFPGKFYSALAGFVEPAETFEDAVRREIWEEAGVRVHGVTYHAGQPWPYPANLMVGFYARADSSQKIRTDLDNELEDAQWFTREQVAAVLNHPDGTNMTGRDLRKYAAVEANKQHTTNATKVTTAFVNEEDGHVTTSPAAAQHAKVAVIAPGDTLKTLSASDEPPFRVPPTTAIAGVLIRDWVEGNAKFARFEGRTKGNL